MFMPSIITGCIILLAGICIFITGRKKSKLLEKYEQEHRASDGTVKFDSTASSLTHGANKNLYRVITIMGFFTGFFGMIFIGYGLYFFTYTAGMGSS